MLQEEFYKYTEQIYSYVQYHAQYTVQVLYVVFDSNVLFLYEYMCSHSHLHVRRTEQYVRVLLLIKSSVLIVCKNVPVYQIEEFRLSTKEFYN